MEYDAIIVGAGLAGLVATTEIAAAGKKVLLLDQEPEASLGGQAWWSFGGLFLVDSPEQRCLGIKDSRDLAWQDWIGTAGYDRLDDEDAWGRKWAEHYVDFAAGEKRMWLKSMGLQFFPVVGWAERGGYLAVRLNILSRKTLGGLQTDLDGRVLDMENEPVPGLYAAGEVSGFGGGGLHGYRSLEGTFLGGCLFTVRTVGRSIAKL